MTDNDDDDDVTNLDDAIKILPCATFVFSPELKVFQKLAQLSHSQVTH